MDEKILMRHPFFKGEDKNTDVPAVHALGCLLLLLMDVIDAGDFSTLVHGLMSLLEPLLVSTIQIVMVLDQAIHLIIFVTSFLLSLKLITRSHPRTRNYG
jgi:hypothetical protein